MDEARYFMTTDHDAHWYIVPTEKRMDWERWLDIDETEPASWEAPAFAKRIGGSPSLVTFTNPVVE